MATDSQSPFLKTTLIISLVLMTAGLVMAFTIIILRFKNMAVVSEDILLAIMAMLLIGSGIALVSFTNGLRAKLMLETAKATEQVSSDGLQSLRKSLLDAIRARIASITLEPSASLSSTVPSQTLNPIFKDSSGTELQPEKDTLGLKWKSDHTEFVNVNDGGVVTLVAAGAAKITVTFRSTTSTPCEVTAICSSQHRRLFQQLPAPEPINS